MKNYHLGYKRDVLDVRDYQLKLARLQPVQSVYLASKYKLPPVYDQLDLGSCTANAVAFLVHFNLLNKFTQSASEPIYRPSRLFIYYYERELEGTINFDSGASLRDGVKVVADKGAPSEDLWQYDINNFQLTPPDKALFYGQKTQAIRYERVDNTNKQLLITVLSQGFPICFGIDVYSSFLDYEVEYSGIIPMPNVQKETLLGGHAMAIVGYRAEDDSFIIRNSWGDQWGQKGYGRIPAQYLTNNYLAGDFWVIKMIE